MANKFSEITPQILELTQKCISNSTINAELYGKYDVKRGLRDINGKGVLAGLTDISEVRSYTVVDSEIVPCEGKLFYRGVDIEQIVSGFIRDKRFGFEETAYLLLFGALPTESELTEFRTLLANYRTLPTSFVRDIIMKAPSSDMMNTLARSVLTLYSYDENANDISLPNVLRQSLQLIALFPLLAVYGYQAYVHYHDGQSLFIHPPVPELSTAENILHILRTDCKYTELEANVESLSRIYRPEGIDLCSRRYQEILHFCRDEYHIAEPALSGIYEAYLSELLHHFALLRAYAPAPARQKRKKIRTSMGSSEFQDLLRHARALDLLHPLPCYLLKQKQYGLYRVIMQIHRSIKKRSAK